ncbi:MAG: tRNA (adenosine(37)-N6)-threonylcarbamoyltransferase complex transferase subunit TsaD [Desulfobacterota bacterium]|nr:tRNA (adenosine(37)-N6)-threonylcarbamoyltransferase complex transferase subunit TsaD [Thermodesulfobacteriota bacterium]MDW8002812.1 tRNA (adenosine(37)-N6)-threonylcarbamoyltransferase complex transferase subunit TsaD [Deltaproteobacteria bacterium]
MYVLGIDTSCDDTSFAILEDDSRVIANTVFNQNELHKLFGGVVPEIASRKHIEYIEPLFFQFMEKCGLVPQRIDLIACTNGPGLIGSILVGLSFAKGLCLSLDKPLIGVNHIEAHAMSIFLERKVDFPFVALVVSGGHTLILLMEEKGNYRFLGSTRDDAAGEAFDKIAKFLNLGYPGGVAIDRISRQGLRDFVRFPRPMIDEDNFDFSFSGLKTAFINYVKKNPPNSDTLHHVVASFQEAVCEVLCVKTVKAAKKFKVKNVVLGGGVAANRRLREMLLDAAKAYDLEIFFPSIEYCTDNAAMVAITGYYHYKIGRKSDLKLKGFSSIFSS